MSGLASSKGYGATWLRLVTRCFVLAVPALLLSGAPRHCFAQQSAASQVIAIPYKPDPPPAIDGDLSEWSKVPNELHFDRAEQVVFGASKWKGPADLSAVVHLAWRQEGLFLAANVTDDVLRQTMRGAQMWRGDHVELFIDTSPGADPTRTALGAGQFQIGFSPGNFGHSGDPLADLTPEAVLFRPNIPATGVRVASTRTETGYTIEAVVPWGLLGVAPAVGTRLAVEVGISDTDGDEARQEKLMTVGTAPWALSRARLLPAVLSPADGVAPLAPLAIALPETRVAVQGQRDLTFQVPALPPGMEAVLALKARLEMPKFGGYTPSLRLSLNGQPLELSRVVNKQRFEERADGKVYDTQALGLFVVPYAPSFDTPSNLAYALHSGVPLANFDFRVTDLLKVGDNVLRVENAPHHPIINDLVLTGALEFRVPEAAARVPLGPPAGPLPVLTPAPLGRVPYTEAHAGNVIKVALNGETFSVQSRFSTPDGAWQTGSNRWFSWRREVHQLDESIVVQDTFTNLGSENLPLMQRHTALMPLAKVWLGGLSPAGMVGESVEPANPTSFGVTEHSGLGLLPFDDVAQVHVTNFCDGKSIGLADNELVLPPGATHVTQWSIVPVARPDYYDFVNAVRRARGVNFPIQGSFAFMAIRPTTVGLWTDRQIADFIRNKSARFLSAMLTFPSYHGHVPHGTAFQRIDFTEWRKELAQRRRAAPDALQLCYFHCFIDSTEDAPQRFPEARLLLSNGAQGDYGVPYYKLYTPTDTNSYGRAVAKNVDIILDDLKFDGVYWDELSYSAYRYQYNEPWDGVSADIDPATKRINRLKSSVTLLSQSWRIALARKILARGPLIGNGGPATASMAQLHFPRFSETGSISNLALVQLYTPIALGDHLTERTEVDAYQDMLRALDYGCVYYWYPDTVIPTYPTLTADMFPITPIELHRGYIIGKERIVTNRSGVFGWNDASTHQVHLFDDRGVERNDYKAPIVARNFVRNGQSLTELRIPEGWGAAIVRVASTGAPVVQK